MIYTSDSLEFLTTKRFNDICGGGKLFVPNGRINFESGLGKQGKSPAFGSVVLKIQEEWEIEMINIEDLKEQDLNKQKTIFDYDNLGI